MQPSSTPLSACPLFCLHVPCGQGGRPVRDPGPLPPFQTRGFRPQLGFNIRTRRPCLWCTMTNDHLSNHQYPF